LIARGNLLAEDKQERPTLHVARTDDFEVNGQGDAGAWKTVEWTKMNLRDEGESRYSSRVKMLYSEKGLYVLMDGSDEKLTSKFTKDFDTLWEGDVFEVFLWPAEEYPIYFEYEITPLGYELPILVPNFDGKFMGWLPWFYGADRITRKAVSIKNGEQKDGAKIEGWTAEIFIPYELLRPLKNVPPKPGSRWRGNFYRMDYDGPKAAWDWSRVGPSFHEYEKFGTLIFD
jgi:hypothetical protein